MRNSARGFSLIEILVGIAVLSVLAAGIAQFSNMNSHMSLRTQGRLSSLLFAQAVSSVLTSSGADCGNNIQLPNPLHPPPYDPAEVIPVKVAPSPGFLVGAGDDVAHMANLNYPGLVIQSLNLANIHDMGTSPTGDQLISASLIFQPASASMDGAGTVNALPAMNLGTVGYQISGTTVKSCSIYLKSYERLRINLVLDNTATPYINYNAANAAMALGYDVYNFPADVTVTILPGVTVGSMSPGYAAFDSGNFGSNSSMAIVNQGNILGAGGSNPGWGLPGTAGSPGINTRLPTSLDNTTGLVYGGGGGGGGGLSFLLPGGVGGVGAGFNNGSALTATTGGPDSGFVWGWNGPGGYGGGWGLPGVDSTSPGGAAGPAVQTNGKNLTWIGGTPVNTKGPIL